ncbi:MAG: tyrosine-type recombinase/integrase, partial [Gammaproteobacteria bacterium]
MPLTDTAIRNTKAGEKPIKLFDGGGLYLLANPNGSRWWRFDYRFAGKRRTLSMGVYPAVGLRQAREKRDAARKQLAAGIDPGLVRKAERSADADSFEAVAREWLAKHAPRWAPGHASKIIGRFERDIFPWLGARPVREITAPELLEVLRRIETRGAIRQLAGRIRTAGGCSGTPSLPAGPSAIRLPISVVPSRRYKEKHHASLTDPKAIGALLRAIDGYQGSFITQSALRLASLTFVRPGELRKAEWSEIDLEAAEWRIPAERMKMRATHIVPLSIQAVAILRELHPLTGSVRYVFPSERTRTRPMSENTVNAGLRRMGYAKDEMTGHGFRSMASTLLNEQGWHRDAIERQLAHGERDAVRAAYNYAEHLPERRRMMQA